MAFLAVGIIILIAVVLILTIESNRPFKKDKQGFQRGCCSVSGLSEVTRLIIRRYLEKP